MTDQQQQLRDGHPPFVPSNTCEAFVIGTNTWPGVCKAIEEAGELIQALGKLMAYPEGPHPDGGDTHRYVMDEAGDVLGALYFLIDHNADLDPNYIEERRHAKYERFVRWHDGE